MTELGSHYVKCIPRESGLLRVKYPPEHENAIQYNTASSSNLDTYDEIILKMTTYCVDDVLTSFRVGSKGATIGRSTDNDISVPADKALATNIHARIFCENGAYYLLDGKNQCGTYVRLNAETNAPEYHWPLQNHCRFRFGHSEFEATYDASSSSVQLILYAHTGKLKGQSFVVDTHGSTIGRSTDNTIHTGDGELSRRHVAIDFNSTNQQFYVRDVGSTNGTFMKLAGPYAFPYRLAIGDQLLLAKTCFAINRFDYGICANMGIRKEMEDMHSVIQEMHIDALSTVGLGPQSFFAVFDGHGGQEVAVYASKHLHRNITNALNAACDENDDGGGLSDKADAIIQQTIMKAFEETDHDILHKTDKPQPGSTATSVFIAGKRMFAANLGDSRTILSKAGQAIALTTDQKPSRKEEGERIREMGGFIINGRIMGELAVSRAFGDIDFKIFDTAIRESSQESDDSGHVLGNGLEMLKGPLVSSTPEITCFDIEEQDEFLVLGSDGLYDVFTNQEIVDFVKEQVDNGVDFQRAAEGLVDYAITTQGSRDNVTAIIIALK